MNAKPAPANGPWSQILSAVTDILFPPLCHGCRAFIPDAGEIHLCRDCLVKSPPIVSPLCTVCGVPFLTEGGSDHVCGGCLAHLPPYETARAAALFEGPAREMIHRFKYGYKVHHARPLGLMTADRIGESVGRWGADLIVPVPLHLKKLRERGFNQAVLLGELLAKQWRLPMGRDNLRRTRWTEPQILLSGVERRENVRGAFTLCDPGEVRDRRVVLVDDVCTTGSTVAECALTLRKGGAAAVFVVTVARAVQD